MENNATNATPTAPTPLELVRAWLALNAMIGDNPELATVQDEIKLAALHLSDAIYTLAHQEEQER